MKRTGYLAGMMACAAVLQVQAADAWKQVHQKSLPQMPGDEVQMVTVGDNKDQVWIGTLSGGAVIEGGVMRPIKATAGLKVWDVLKRPEGGLWIGHGEGVMLVDGERTVPMLKGRSVAALQMVGTQVWAIANEAASDRNTLMQVSGEAWVPVPMFKDRRVTDLIMDAKGTAWLALEADGVFEIDPVSGPKKHHLPKMKVMAVMTDSKGRTWCGLDQGGVMLRQADGTWQGHLGKEHPTVLTLAEDGNGAIWAATSGNGLWVYDGTSWKNLLTGEGSVNLLKVTSDKRVWVSTQNGGLKYWDGKDWVLSLEGSMPMRCLTELPKGVLVAGGVLDGLYILGDYTIKGE